MGKVTFLHDIHSPRLVVMVDLEHISVYSDIEELSLIVIILGFYHLVY